LLRATVLINQSIPIFLSLKLTNYCSKCTAVLICIQVIKAVKMVKQINHMLFQNSRLM